MDKEDKFYEDYLDSIYKECFQSSSRECINNMIQKLSGSNLILYVLYFVKDRQTITSLSKTIHVSIPRMTVILDSLEGKKLIKRIHDKNDQRIVYAALTKKGREEMDKEHAKKREKACELLKEIGKDDLLVARRILNIIKKYEIKEEMPC